MNLVLWIVAGLLALVFALTGLMKLTQPKEKLAASGLRWTEDYNATTIKTVAVLDLLAAIGLILPAQLNIVPMLVPLAALGLVLIMVGAAYTHSRRKEFPMFVETVVLLALPAFVAWGRLGAAPFTV